MKTIAYMAGFALIAASSASPVSASLKGQVTVLDLETVMVNWTVAEKEFKFGLEILYSPVRSSYYIVQPILNPAAETVMLEKLLPFTSYQMIIRTTNTTKTFLQTKTIYFSTSVVTAFESTKLLRPARYKNEEIMLVFGILFIWGVVLSLFFQRWGKIRSLLPYQPVYSKEMADKIDQIEAEKNMRSNRTSFSFFPLDCDCTIKQEIARQGNLKAKQTAFNPCKTSSTFFLPHCSSIDVDCEQLRKTKSADNVGCPQIVIDRTISRQVSRSNTSLPSARSNNFLQPDSYQLDKRRNSKRSQSLTPMMEVGGKEIEAEDGV